MDTLSFFQSLTSGDPKTVAIAAAAIAACLLAPCAWKKTGGTFYRPMVAVACFTVLTSMALFGFGLTIAASVAILLFILTLAAAALLYRFAERKLNQAIGKCDQMSFEYNPVEALRTLQSVNQKALLDKQLARYERYLVSIDIALGNGAVAKERLTNKEKPLKVSPAFKHFALHIIADRAGDFDESQNQLTQAFALKDRQGCDVLTAIQLEQNQAALDISKGRYASADQALSAAIEHASREKVKNKDILNVVYENCALNKTRLGHADGGLAAGLAVIDEYESTLDLENDTDRGALFNMKLLLFRQCSLGAQDKAAIYEENVKWTENNERLSAGRKIATMASLLRIAWADGLDPKQPIEYLAEHLGDLREMSGYARYLAFSNARVACFSLASNTVPAEILAREVGRYFAEDAEHDLDEQGRELPVEARLPRAQLLREKAAYAQDKGDFEGAKRLMGECIETLEGGLQNMQAIEEKLALAKMLAVAGDHEAKGLTDSVVKELEGLQSHPSLGYPYSQAAFCYALMNAREECLRAYELAEQFHTPMDHYSPTVRAEKAVAAFCARFFLFLDGINRLKAGRCAPLDENVRKWVDGYPQVTGTSACIALGRFLGYEGNMPLMRRCWLVENTALSFEHVWLYVQEANIAFDPLIRDTRTGLTGLVFIGEKHPILNPGEKEVAQLERDGLTLLDPQATSGSEEMMCKDDRDTISEVVKALTAATERDAPSTEDLLHAYQDGIADVAIK